MSWDVEYTDEFGVWWDALNEAEQEDIAFVVHDVLTEVPLQDLREARQLTQEQLAEHLKIGQAAVSKLERRTDMYVSTLRRFIEAMGGELEIIARFPEGSVRITNFSGEPRRDTAA